MAHAVGRHDGGTMAVSMGKRRLPEPEIETLRRHAKVLVVDDDSDLRETVCMILEMNGYSPAQAGNGAEGLSLFRKEGFDLVISDFHMPQMNGLQMLIEMKKLRSDIPVIIASAAADEGEREGFRAAGAFLILRKPFEIAELESAIDRALNAH